MAEIDVKFPEMGEGSIEAVILNWHVEVGDPVEEGQTIVEIETDKATIEVPSPEKGFLKQRLADKGDVIKNTDSICVIENDISKLVQSQNQPLSVMVRVGVLCERCNNVIPVNGFVEEVKCGKCMETTQLSGRLKWSEILNYHNPGIDVFSATKKHKQGEGDYGAWQPVKLKTWRKWPACRCSHEFNEKEVETAVNNTGEITCTECKAVTVLKPVPGFIQKQFPQVLFSVDELPHGMSQADGKINGLAPVVMKCMSCGGTLSVDGSVRLVPCKFCSSSNYLPDDLWLALHPQPVMKDWYILFK